MLHVQRHFSVLFNAKIWKQLRFVKSLIKKMKCLGNALSYNVEFYFMF